MALHLQNLPSIADKTIEVDNITIAYKDEGNGKVILCLHAIGHSSKDFLLLYNLPLEKYRIISVDFPAHGKSGMQTQTITAAYFAKIILAFIDALNLKNLILIGNSIGGATAIRVASNNPNIKMLSLSNPAGLDKRGVLAPFFLNYMIRFFKQGVNHQLNFQSKFSSYYKKVLLSEAAKDRRDEIVEGAFQLAPLLVEAWTSFKSKEEDLRPFIETINCPVLFTWAMKDKFVQYGRNKKSIEKFRKYKLHKYKIGHTPYLECPELFLKDLVEFINETVQ
jgi:pimeloyl-ACP methyl ester carboxylesterase